MYNYGGDKVRKRGYCLKCDFEFDYVVNNMNDLNNLLCPKCGNRIDVNSKKVVPPSKFSKNADKIAYKVLDFYYYFYLIFSIIGIVSFYLGFNKLLIISSIISFIVYFIELMIGFTRNIFGLFGLLVSFVIGVFVVNDLLIGICIGSCYLFFISGIFKIIFNLIINRLYRKYG